jgi:hypothetical protein
MEEHIELWQAKLLKAGDAVYAIGYYEKDGSPQKYIVQREPKTWKRNAQRVEVQLKRGKENIIMTELCLEEFTIFAPEPKFKRM